MTLFKNFDPLGFLVLLSDQMAKIRSEEGLLGESVHLAGSLATHAINLYRGHYSDQLSLGPHAPESWEFSALPWCDEYHSSVMRDDGLKWQPKHINAAEITLFIKKLNGVWDAYPVGRPAGMTYRCKTLCGQAKSRVQGLAVEVLLCVDGAFDCIAAGKALEALMWTNDAHVNFRYLLLEADRAANAMHVSIPRSRLAVNGKRGGAESWKALCTHQEMGV